MASYRDLLKAAKAEVREIDPETAEARFGDSTFLDVRELDEFEQGMIPGAVFIPRGHLESQAEHKLPDRDANRRSTRDLQRRGDPVRHLRRRGVP